MVCSTPPPDHVPVDERLMPAGRSSSLRQYACPTIDSDASHLQNMTTGGSAGIKHRCFPSDKAAVQAAIRGTGFEASAAADAIAPGRKVRRIGQKRKSSPLLDPPQDPLHIACDMAKQVLQGIGSPASHGAAVQVSRLQAWHKDQPRLWNGSANGMYPGLEEFATLL